MGKSFKYHDSGTEGNPLSDRMNAALESDIDNKTIGNMTQGRDKYKGNGNIVDKLEMGTQYTMMTAKPK